MHLPLFLDKINVDIRVCVCACVHSSYVDTNCLGGKSSGEIYFVIVKACWHFVE